MHIFAIRSKERGNRTGVSMKNFLIDRLDLWVLSVGKVSGPSLHIAIKLIVAFF